MLNMSSLCYWTLRMFPCVITPISACMQNTLERGRSFSQHISGKTLFYVEDGAVDCQFLDDRSADQGDGLEAAPDDGAAESIHMTGPMLLYLRGDGTLDVRCLSDRCRILLLMFRVRTLVDDKGLPIASLLAPEVTARSAELYVELPSRIQIEYGSFEHRLLGQIRYELETHSQGHMQSVQTALSQLLISLVRHNPPVPHFVDGVAVYSSVDDGKPFPDGRQVWLTDVEIWCNDPRESKKAALLRTMRTEQFFVGHSKGIFGKIRYALEEDTTGDAGQSPVGCLTAEGLSNYIVLLWPEKGIKPLKIDHYPNKWLYLRLKAKSNMTGSVGLALYSTAERHWFGRPIVIDTPEVWKEYVIPILYVHAQATASPYVSRAVSYIEEHYAQNLHLADIATELYIHPNYLSTIFKKEKGISISAYISNYRLMIAQKLLLESDMSIETIALETGFYDIQHFSKAFKRKIGPSPQAFREASRSSAEAKAPDTAAPEPADP